VRPTIQHGAEGSRPGAWNVDPRIDARIETALREVSTCHRQVQFAILRPVWISIETSIGQGRCGSRQGDRIAIEWPGDRHRGSEERVASQTKLDRSPPSAGRRVRRERGSRFSA